MTLNLTEIQIHVHVYVTRHAKRAVSSQFRQFCFSWFDSRVIFEKNICYVLFCEI